MSGVVHKGVGAVGVDPVFLRVDVVPVEEVRAENLVRRRARKLPVSGESTGLAVPVPQTVSGRQRGNSATTWSLLPETLKVVPRADEYAKRRGGLLFAVSVKKEPFPRRFEKLTGNEAFYLGEGNPLPTDRKGGFLFEPCPTEAIPFAFHEQAQEKPSVRFPVDSDKKGFSLKPLPNAPFEGEEFFGIHRICCCRIASKRSTPVATATFNDPTRPRIGMCTRVSHRSATSRARPLPSPPTTRALRPRKS